METFFGVALILAGSIWFLWSLYSLWKGRKSEDWSITTGIITKSDVIDLSIQKGHGTCPLVHYEYSILGKTYKSDRIFWGNVHTSGSEDASRRIADKYKKGKKVTVYYNPPQCTRGRSGTRFSTRYPAFACCELHTHYRRNYSAYDRISEETLS